MMEPGSLCLLWISREGIQRWQCGESLEMLLQPLAVAHRMVITPQMRAMHQNLRHLIRTPIQKSRHCKEMISHLVAFGNRPPTDSELFSVLNNRQRWVQPRQTRRNIILGLALANKHKKRAFF